MSTNIAESLRSSLQALVADRVTVDGKSIQETTLVRNGSYCGRRFALAGYSLVWFQEEGQVKLYGPLGNLEQSCSVVQFCMVASTKPLEIRRAA
jgi:hypothetical protein